MTEKVNPEKVLSMSIIVECPVFTNATLEVVTELSFWVGGALNCLIAVFGLLINIVSAYVLLTNHFMKNTFNTLLSILLIIDSICLVFILIEVLSNTFRLQVQLYDIFHPYFFHPFRNISLTSSIFMTIAIAHERYKAIQYPVLHRQNRRSTRFRRALLSKYTLVVILSATLINIPKFFEAEVQWRCTSYNLTDDVSNSSIIGLTNR